MTSFRMNKPLFIREIMVNYSYKKSKINVEVMDLRKIGKLAKRIEMLNNKMNILEDYSKIF